MIVFFVKETSSIANRSKQFRFTFKSVDRNFRRYLFILVLFTLGNSSDAFLLFRVEEAIRESSTVVNFVNGIKPLHDMISAFGNTRTQAELINILFLPIIWSFFHIIKVVFSTPFGVLSDRIGRKITINIGWAIYSSVYFSFAFLTFFPEKFQILATVILFAIYALYYAFTEGAERAFVSDIVNEENRGSAFGLYNFAIGLAALPASVIFGAVYSIVNNKFPGLGATAAFSLGGFLAMSAMLLLTFFVKETKRNENNN
jgi:MFS family permease